MWLELAAWVILWGAVATLGHELTHYLVYMTFAHHIEFDLMNMQITAEYDDTHLNRRLAAVAGVSPLVVGVVVLAALSAPWWSEGLTIHRMIVVVALLIYTFTGGWSDYRPALQQLQSAA